MRREEDSKDREKERREGPGLANLEKVREARSGVWGVREWKQRMPVSA